MSPEWGSAYQLPSRNANSVVGSPANCVVSHQMGISQISVPKDPMASSRVLEYMGDRGGKENLSYNEMYWSALRLAHFNFELSV